MADLSGNVVVDISNDPPPPPDEEHPDYVPTGPTGPIDPTSPMTRRASFDNHFSKSTHTPVKEDDEGNKIPTHMTIAEVKQLMNEDYSDPCFNLSTSMDIIAVYIKAQKILYTEAKVYCEQQLNMLMLPAICISAICTLLSLALQGEVAGPYVISALTAINSFILALISYLKLDAKAEAHKTSAYNYSRLLTICEFQSGKIMFFKRDDKPDDFEKLYNEIYKIATEIQKNVGEIQDTNKFILPQYIRYNFRILNEQNLFSKVKKLQLEELDLLNKLKVSLRKVHEKNIPFTVFSKGNKIVNVELLFRTPDDDKTKQDYLSACMDREEKMRQIIEHRKKYLTLEEAFSKEINEYIQKAKGYRCGCNWLKS